MEESTLVINWWYGMMGIAVLNFILLGITYKVYRKRLPSYTDLLKHTRKWQMGLALYYTLVCAFRCFVPKGDVKRIVMIDHWISAVAIGRTLVTFAELAFVLQWSLVLYEIGKSTGNKVAMGGAKVIVPLIIIAEVFSWYACTTTNYLGSVIEESFWGISAAVFVAGLVSSRKFYEGVQRKFIAITSFFGSGYVLYMFLVDVPTYTRGWLADTEAGVQYATVIDGLIETATVWHYSRSYEDWQYLIVWQTLYFSLAVWGSQLLVNAPRLDVGKSQ